MPSPLLASFLATTLLLLVSQTTGMMLRSTISSHVHTYQVIKTHAPPHLHFANRYHEPLAPFNVSFFGLNFTLHLDIDYEYLQHVAPETLNKIDVTRFLYGHVGEFPSTSTVRLYTYERGIDGHMVVKSETNKALYDFQFETVVEDDGELSDDVIVFRPQDKMRLHPKQMQACGVNSPAGGAHAGGLADIAVTTSLNATGLPNVTDAWPNGIHPTEGHKYGPPDYEGHKSLEVLRMAKSLHLSRPPSYDDPMHAHRMVQHGLRRRELWKRDRTDPKAVNATGKTNKYKAAAMTIIYDPYLDDDGKMATWISMTYASISTRTAELEFTLVAKFTKPDESNLKSIDDPGQILEAMKKFHSDEGQRGVLAVQLMINFNHGNLLGFGTIGSFGTPSVSFASFKNDDQIKSTGLHELLHNLGLDHEGQDPSIMSAIDAGSPFAEKQWGPETEAGIKRSLASGDWYDPGTLLLDFQELAGEPHDITKYKGPAGPPNPPGGPGDWDPRTKTPIYIPTKTFQDRIDQGPKPEEIWNTTLNKITDEQVQQFLHGTFHMSVSEKNEAQNSTQGIANATSGNPASGSKDKSAGKTSKDSKSQAAGGTPGKNHQLGNSNALGGSNNTSNSTLPITASEVDKKQSSSSPQTPPIKPTSSDTKGPAAYSDVGLQGQHQQSQSLGQGRKGANGSSNQALQRTVPSPGSVARQQLQIGHDTANKAQVLNGAHTIKGMAQPNPAGSGTPTLLALRTATGQTAGSKVQGPKKKQNVGSTGNSASTGGGSTQSSASSSTQSSLPTSSPVNHNNGNGVSKVGWGFNGSSRQGRSMDGLDDTNVVANARTKAMHTNQETKKTSSGNNKAGGNSKAVDTLSTAGTGANVAPVVSGGSTANNSNTGGTLPNRLPAKNPANSPPAPVNGQPANSDLGKGSGKQGAHLTQFSGDQRGGATNLKVDQNDGVSTVGHPLKSDSRQSDVNNRMDVNAKSNAMSVDKGSKKTQSDSNKGRNVAQSGSGSTATSSIVQAAIPKVKAAQAVVPKIKAATTTTKSDNSGTSGTIGSNSQGSSNAAPVSGGSSLHPATPGNGSTGGSSSNQDSNRPAPNASGSQIQLPQASNNNNGGSSSSSKGSTDAASDPSSPLGQRGKNNNGGITPSTSQNSKSPAHGPENLSAQQAHIGNDQTGGSTPNSQGNGNGASVVSGSQVQLPPASKNNNGGSSLNSQGSGNAPSDTGSLLGQSAQDEKDTTTVVKEVVSSSNTQNAINPVPESGDPSLVQSPTGTSGSSGDSSSAGQAQSQSEQLVQHDMSNGAQTLPPTDLHTGNQDVASDDQANYQSEAGGSTSVGPMTFNGDNGGTADMSSGQEGNGL
ncbi:hypothetical protein RI367_004557 [Sorochytrium milnesiophthora]